MRFRLGRKKIMAGPGTVVVVPAGMPHDFANAGDSDALVRVEVRPALQMEQLFETAVALAAEGRTMQGHPETARPRPVRAPVRAGGTAAFPPLWVQRLALAPLARLATRRGYAARYESAPAAIGERLALEARRPRETGRSARRNQAAKTQKRSPCSASSLASCSVDLANARRGDGLLGAHLFDLEACLVFVQVLADQTRLAVVRPDEGLPARGVVHGARVVDLVADRLEVGSASELVERELVGDSPVRDGKAVVRVPQHGLADAAVERASTPSLPAMTAGLAPQVTR